MEKIIAYPGVYLGFLPHYPELDAEKLHRFKNVHVAHRRVRQSHRGSHEVGDVLAAPPILCCTHNDSFYILNGKHRTVVAAILGYPIELALIENRSEIRHSIAREWMGGLNSDELLEQFDNRHSWVDHCAAHGVHSIAQLAKKEHGKIRSVFEGATGLSAFGKSIVHPSGLSVTAAS